MHNLTYHKDGKLKEEIELKDDSRLVDLMIDYLYQMDYDDSQPSRSHTEPIEEAPAEPESPVARTVSYYENLGQNKVSPDALSSEPVLEPEVFDIPQPVAAATDDERFSGLDKKNKKYQELRLKCHSDDVATERLTINTLMYSLADKYEIDDLKTLAKTKFAEAVDQDWDSQAFVYAAELVFNTTPSSDQGLRSIVVKTMNQHRQLLHFEEVHKLLELGNGMAWALVQVLLDDDILLR